MQVVHVLLTGAMMSTHFPQLLKTANMSLMSLAATVTLCFFFKKENLRVSFEIFNEYCMHACAMIFH